MKISVIICTYNREKYLPQLFESLIRQDFPKSDYEIVFVNNNSPDATAQRCIEFQEKYSDINFSYFEEKKQGLSHARNRGIREAKGELLAFIDDDAVAHDGYLKKMFEAFSTRADMYAAGGKIVPLYESNRPKWMNRFLEPLMSVIDLGTRVKIFPRNKFPIGANMIFRREVFEKTENFNTELGRTGKKMLGGEEKDLFFRMREKGLSVYWIPDIVVSHSVPDERLQEAFIKKQALGVGQSEVIRTRRFGQGKLWETVAKELFKWCATGVLFLFYGLTFQWAKARMTLLFRFWVSKGMLNEKN